MGEQLSLFVEENTLFNIAVKQLLDMDFRGCKETLQSYHKQFPWGRDTSWEVAMAEFWLQRFGEVNWDHVDAAEAERGYQLWLEFEANFGHPWPEHGIEQLFQVQYFSQLVEGLRLSGHGEVPKLSGGTPTGLVYLLAGRIDASITSLQALIASEPENARAYGYLGDAYILRRDLQTARLCYQEAFGLAPKQVDLGHLRDKELKERLEGVETDERIDGDLLGWFPTSGKLHGRASP